MPLYPECVSPMPHLCLLARLPAATPRSGDQAIQLSRLSSYLVLRNRKLRQRVSSPQPHNERLCGFRGPRYGSSVYNVEALLILRCVSLLGQSQGVGNEQAFWASSYQIFMLYRFRRPTQLGDREKRSSFKNGKMAK